MSTCGCNLISFTAEKLLSITSKKLWLWYIGIGLEINNGSIQNKSHTALVLVI